MDRALTAGVTQSLLGSLVAAHILPTGQVLTALQVA